MKRQFAILLFLLISALLSYGLLYYNSTSSTIKIKSEIEQNLRQEYNLFKKNISNYLAGEDNKSEILLLHFKQDSLIYWSNNKYFLSTEDLKKNLIQSKNATYLKLTDTIISNDERIVALLILSTNYLVNNDLLKSGLNPKVFNTIEGEISLIKNKDFIKINTLNNSFYLDITSVKDNIYRDYYRLIFHIFILSFILYLCWFFSQKKSIKLQISLLLFLELSSLIYLIYSTEKGHYVILMLLFVLLSTLFIINYFRRLVFEFIKKTDKNIFLLFVSSVASISTIVTLISFKSVLNNHFLEISIDYFLNMNIDTILVFADLVLISFTFLSVYLLLNYFIHRFNCRTTEITFVQITLLFLPFLLGLYLFFIFTTSNLGLLIAIFIIGFLNIIYLRFDSIYILNFKTYLFFISFLSQISVVFVAVQSQIEEHKNILEQQTLSDKLLIQNDFLGESLLDKLDADLKKDAFINSQLSDPFGSKSFIQNKIEKYYLNNYFDKYDVEVNVLNNLDIQFLNVGDSLKIMYNDKQIELKRTEYDNLFIEKTKSYSPFIRYIKIINLDDFKAINANILIELKLRELKPNSVIPLLVLDQKHIEKSIEKYSYAIYQNNSIVYKNGNFNYEKLKFPSKNAISYNFKDENFIHFVHHIEDKNIVISMYDNSILFMLSNFAFFFIGSWIILQFFILLYLYIRFLNDKSFTVSILTKIQLLVNFIIILPLVILSIMMIRIERQNYFEDLEQKFISKVEPISIDLKEILNENTSKYDKKELLKNCAKRNQVDIIVYDLKGEAIGFSQSLLEERKLYTKLISFQALHNFEFNNYFFLDEYLGNLNYKSLYFSVKNAQNENSVYVNVPYFQATSELNEKLTSYFIRILAIFIVIFFVAVIISYWASRSFSRPLSMLSTKLNSISLKENTPILWESNDEIGVLIQQYNAMIQKLKESSTLLAQQEKETAWKEMAKQVAHEIKNPLTPMRLSLQLMDRKLHSQEVDTEKFHKTIEALITEIDTLDDIAKSFSSFATMPKAKNEKISILEIIQKTIDLHSQTSQIHFSNKLKSPKVVFCDAGLMSRVFTNLILNGIQASTNENPRIDISIEEDNKNVIISFKDYGVGIPKEIQSKVFVPNFSTKFTGSGIGLALAKKTIEEVNGEIFYETKEQIGTTFIIKLPFIINEF